MDESWLQGSTFCEGSSLWATVSLEFLRLYSAKEPRSRLVDLMRKISNTPTASWTIDFDETSADCRFCA
jgi:hypothetical protein